MDLDINNQVPFKYYGELLTTVEHLHRHFIIILGSLWLDHQKLLLDVCISKRHMMLKMRYVYLGMNHIHTYQIKYYARKG